MVEKREGATMICHQCGDKLFCRMSNYKHPYTNKLQWQNQDGTAHFKYDGGKFTCTGVDKKSKELKKALAEQDEFMKEADLSKGP
ncbi:MAG: hypothetical protein ACE5RJ_01320 [Nitrosopumilaceae archaeon]